MTTRKLIVEVCNAHNLMPKDGQGTSSPYAIVDFDGQRHRTKTKPRDLNPQWNEKLEFLVNDPDSIAAEVLEVNVYNDKKIGKRSNFLGRLKIWGSSFVKQGLETMVYYPLDKRSVFSQVKGELGLKVYYVDEEPEPQPAPVPAEQEVSEKPAEATEAPQPANEEENAQENQPTEAENPAEPEAAEDKKREDEAAKPPEEPKTEEMPAKEDEIPQVEVAVKTAPVFNRPAQDFRYSVDYDLKDLNPRSLGAINGDRTSTYDLVEQMPYLYVRVIKARNLAAKDLNGSSDPYAKITVGNHSIRTRTISNNLNPDWDQVFAIAKEKLSSPTLEISLWDADVGKKDDFLGVVSFDLQEVPSRVPPDSPLAPQWYRLEDMRGEGKVKGDVMLVVWMGTQADEAFPEAWQSDTGGLLVHTRSKVYLSPKLWYLRVNVIEAQDVQPQEKSRYVELSVKAQLGSQCFNTRVSTNRSNSPFWNEDLVFVAAEPFEEHLVLTLEDRVGPEKEEAIGHARIFLNAIERRTDHRQVSSRWVNLEKKEDQEENGGDSKFKGRLHLRLCFDGGYHVLDEAAQLTSDIRPTAKQLWKPAVGVLEVGILGAKNLVPIKSKDGRGVTDAYCVAKYGQKWIRSRTVVDSFNPKWNEQYTWEVYDPCTVFTLGVFDNCHIYTQEKSPPRRDLRIGKVRIRISTLQSDRIYTNAYPLLLLHPSGVKKMGEIELAVRFSSYSVMNVLQLYTQPLLPKMHYLFPLGLGQQDLLRHTAMKIVAFRLSRSEPPLRQEVVQYMLDCDTHMWSMRRSKANWFRIINVLSGLMAIFNWIDCICHWKNPITTVLVHFLFLILVWYPELILPTVFLYMFLIGAWNYRFRPRMPLHMDARLSCANVVNSDELDEEFDTFPTSRSPDIVRMRYDRLRSLAGRIQTVLGDMASQGERIHSLLSWRDPRATASFTIFCLLAAVLLYVTPFRIIVIMFGLYFLRHPRFRDPLPSAPLNFFRRLPALSDRIL